MNRFLFWSLAFCSTLLLGCGGESIPEEKIFGSGTKTESIREVTDFTAIEMKTFGEVDVSFGQETSVTVSIDDNLVDIVDTTVMDGKLTIATKKRFSSGLGPKVSIKMPVLTDVEFLGQGAFAIREIKGDSLTIKMPGTGALTASGEVQSLYVDVSGVGNAILKKLSAKSAVFKLSGAGNIEASVVDSLKVESSGTGSIKVIGNPKDVEKKITGTGSVDISIE
jgi:hypothetical protein